ncbi:MAG: phage tail tube protein [Paludibacteraceae bacterium]
MLHGNNLIVSLDGMPVASSTGCELQMEREFMEVCGPKDGAWLQYLPTTLGWTVSADGLLADMAAVQALHERMVSGQAVALRFYDSTFSVLYKGAAYVKSLRFSGQVRNLAKYSISLQGSGALATDTEGYRLELPANADHSLLGYKLSPVNRRCAFINNDGSEIYPFVSLYAVRLPRCRVVAHEVFHTGISGILMSWRSQVAVFRVPWKMISDYVNAHYDPDRPNESIYTPYLPFCQSGDNYDEGVEPITDVILPAGEYTVAVEYSNVDLGNDPWLQVFS